MFLGIDIIVICMNLLFYKIEKKNYEYFFLKVIFMLIVSFYLYDIYLIKR